MDAGGLYGQHGLLKYSSRSSSILSTPVHNGPFKNFSNSAIPVFFNSVFLFFIFLCLFLSHTVDEPKNERAFTFTIDNRYFFKKFHKNHLQNVQVWTILCKQRQ